MRSLRARSIAAAAVAVVLALVAVGVVADVLLSRHLNRSLDHTLRARAVEVAQLSASAPALLSSPGALDAPLGGQQLDVQVVDRRGRIVARSLALGGRVLPLRAVARDVIADGRARSANIELGSDDVRAYVAPLAETGGVAAGGAVAVAAARHDISATVGSLRLFVLVGGLVAAGLAGLVLAALTGHALAPLARLTRSAADIERTGDPRRRLPEPATSEELADLTRTLNAMLASLERARDSERRFLADASHELRTPLTALTGNVAYIAKHGATPEVVQELQADAARLARLADDLLTLSREEASTPADERVRLDQLALAAGTADDTIDVVAPEVVLVRGDPVALERALGNLIENARRYGPARGRVVVEVQANGAGATLSVTDEGAGLQPYEAERAFARFWRGRSDLPGSGLGLAIVRATAERLGGRAYAEGSRFTIELPVLRDASESAATTSAGRPSKGSP